MYAVLTRVQFISALSEENCCMSLQADSHAGVFMLLAGSSEAFRPAAEAA